MPLARAEDGDPLNAVRLWDLKTGEPGRVLWRNDEKYAVVFTSVVFSPDGQLIAASVSVKDDCTIRMWDVATGREVRRWSGFPGTVFLAFSPDGQWLVAGSKNQARVRRWDLQNPNNYREIHLDH